MAPHSSTLAWKTPWTEEPVRLQSMGSLGVRHDWAISLSLFTFMHWRRKWQPTPVFLPGESQGWGSLLGCRLWVAQGRTRLKRLSSSSSNGAPDENLNTETWMRFLGWPYYVLMSHINSRRVTYPENKRGFPFGTYPRLCLMGLHTWLDPFPLISHNCDYNNFQWVLWNFQVNYQNRGCLRKSLQICNWSQM